MKSTEALVHRLYSNIHTTDTLRQVSDTLEILAQNANFKEHASAIVADSTLTDPQKKTQLVYIIKSINSPILYEFFYDILGQNTFWLFDAGKVNYFDKFVQEFQKATENIGIVYLTTAVVLQPQELRDIALDLSKAFGYKVVLNHSVSPNIIGGAQVRVENFVFDYSLRSKFQQFERRWISSINKTNKLVDRHDI